MISHRTHTHTYTHTQGLGMGERRQDSRLLPKHIKRLSGFDPPWGTGWGEEYSWWVGVNVRNPLGTDVWVSSVNLLSQVDFL